MMVSKVLLISAGICTLAKLVFSQELGLGKAIITGVEYAGSGCPEGSVAIGGAGSTGFGINYSAFNVTIGPKTNATVTRQDCTVTLGITYPPGLQFAPASFNSSGFFELEKGFSGQLSTTYYFSGGTTQSGHEARFTGPSNDTYLLTDPNPEYLAYSPCGSTSAYLIIRSSIRLRRDDSFARNVAGVFALTDGTVNYVYWKQCPA
ncbi:hypothetical protein DL98DRAFT_573922 [Cadophora sp. DSE1049]|nr:hypothetical protein DL98DRAFT_573922 [Cadophora sp. DSE1049]